MKIIPLIAIICILGNFIFPASVRADVVGVSILVLALSAIIAVLSHKSNKMEVAINVDDLQEWAKANTSRANNPNNRDFNHDSRN